jgi:glutaredoxin 3
MNSIRIYTTTGCPFSDRAREFLDEKGIPYHEIDITDDDERREEMVRLAAGTTSTPQIFIGDEHIGGADDLERADKQGRLTNLVLTPEPRPSQ